MGEIAYQNKDIVSKILGDGMLFCQASSHFPIRS